MPTPKSPSIKNVAAANPIQPKGPFHFIGRKFNIIFILSVIGLCFALYGPTIPNEFSLDDEFVIHNDSIVAKGIKGIPELFKTRYAWDQKGSYGYRPVVKVSFAIEYALFKDSPHWGHLINILLYAFVCLFIFYFFRKLLYSQLSDYFLLVALLLFIVLPIHSEVVASLKNRDELLSFLFGLYCCYAMLNWFEAEKLLPRALWGISGCLGLGLGILCKPDAVLFIPITLLFLYFFASKGVRAASFCLLLMMLFLLIGSGFIQRHVLPHTDYRRTFLFIENPLVGVHWWHKFPLAFSTVWFYISKLFFPKDLVCYYGYNAFDAFPKWTDFGVLAGIVLAGLLLYLIIKHLKKKTAILFFLLLFSGTLFPYTDLYEVGPGIVAERFMFLPSLSFVFLVTYLLFYLFKLQTDKKPVGKLATYFYVFILSVCLVFTVRVLVRDPDWKTHRSVYLHDSEEAPLSAKLQSLLAATYVAEAENISISAPQQKLAIDSLFVKGLRAYQRSVDDYPGYGTSWNNLGMITFTLYGNAAAALHDFSKALEVDSTYSEAWFNVGACHELLANKAQDTLTAFQNDSTSMAKNKFYGRETIEALNKKTLACKNRMKSLRHLAEDDYSHTIEIKPTYYIAYIHIARVYSAEGKYDKIVALDSNAIKNGYLSDPIFVTLGNVYLARHDTINAAINYEKSISYYARNYYVLNFLKDYYTKKGEMDIANHFAQLYNNALHYKK